MNLHKRTFSVWRFKSIDGNQVVIVPKPYHPGAYENEYNRIIMHVDAYSERDALDAYKNFIG